MKEEIKQDGVFDAWNDLLNDRQQYRIYMLFWKLGNDAPTDILQYYLQKIKEEGMTDLLQQSIEILPSFTVKRLFFSLLESVKNQTITK